MEPQRQLYSVSKTTQLTQIESACKTQYSCHAQLKVKTTTVKSFISWDTSLCEYRFLALQAYMSMLTFLLGKPQNVLPKKIYDSSAV